MCAKGGRHLDEGGAYQEGPNALHRPPIEQRLLPNKHLHLQYCLFLFFFSILQLFGVEFEFQMKNVARDNLKVKIGPANQGGRSGDPDPPPHSSIPERLTPQTGEGAIRQYFLLRGAFLNPFCTVVS